MIVAVIILSLLLITLVCLTIFKRDWVEGLFGSNVISKVQQKKKLEGEIEVLKKQQKVEVEKISKETDEKKAHIVNTINADIAALNAQIDNLKKEKTTRQDLLDQERKVLIDKKVNDFNQQITFKQNKVKRLEHFIDAERKNQEDALNPDQPNAPKQILLENKKK